MALLALELPVTELRAEARLISTRSKRFCLSSGKHRLLSPKAACRGIFLKPYSGKSDVERPERSGEDAAFFAGLGQKQIYDFNGVHYDVSSRFVKDRVESKNTIRNRVERILQNPVHLTLLSELVGKIIIHETEGTGRNRTQRIEICCRFAGYLDIPESPQSPIYQEHIRQSMEQAFYTA